MRSAAAKSPRASAACAEVIVSVGLLAAMMARAWARTDTRPCARARSVRRRGSVIRAHERTGVACWCASARVDGAFARVSAARWRAGASGARVRVDEACADASPRTEARPAAMTSAHHEKIMDAAGAAAAARVAGEAASSRRSAAAASHPERAAPTRGPSWEDHRGSPSPEHPVHQAGDPLAAPSRPAAAAPSPHRPAAPAARAPSGRAAVR
jgi:hypothetical protein